MERMTATVLGDGRLRLVDGPLDLVLAADGSPGAVEAAHRAARDRFRSLLGEIEAEIDLLRSPAETGSTALAGTAARRMWRAVRPFAAEGLAPVAAFEGAAAEEILAAVAGAAALDRVFVALGGASALHLTPGFAFRAALRLSAHAPQTEGAVEVRPGDMVRGVGTAGRGDAIGSPGLLDAVTVFAQTAAKASAAAAVVAAAAAPGGPVEAIPAPAWSAFAGVPVPVSAGEDGERLAAALDAAEGVARALFDRGLLAGAVLRARGTVRAVGAAPIAGIGEPEQPKRAGGRR